ncbi:MAG TPA: alpha/beta hydrolase [Polyangiaceae bacterium]|nr:alpha/beta hydrolase [Polyangiaceae bacterium]
MLRASLARRAFGLAQLLSPAISGPPPVNDRGVRLDRQTHLMLTFVERLGLPTADTLGPDRARASFKEEIRLVGVRGGPLANVHDRRIPGPDGTLAIRIYTPRSAAPTPALVYFHGGGWVIGDLDSHDATCRHLSHRAGVKVIAVDYRRAPEDPFPAAVEDAIAAFQWIRTHAEELDVDPDRIAVGGDSAGGNLAAVVCQQLLQAGQPTPCFQLLIYPATDLTRSTDSHQRFGEGFLLTHRLLDWFLANYLTDTAQELDPRASPIATADLGGLPPAHVVVAGFDPLRDEGEAYAHALRAAGVPTTLRCYGSLVHGFFSMGGLVAAAGFAADDIADVVGEALKGSASVRES